MTDFTNYIGYVFVAAGIFLLSLIKGSEPWRLSVLGVGIALIILAAMSFGLLTDISAFFETLSKAKKLDEKSYAIAKSIASLWTFVLPAVTAAIGANLITAWFLAKKPTLPSR